MLPRPLFTFVSDVTHLDEFVGRYQSAVDEPALVYNVATIYQLTGTRVRELMPSEFT